MRTIAHVTALVALLAFAVAAGDFVSNPNVLGAFGLLAFVVIGGLALAQLYRPDRIPRVRKVREAPDEPPPPKPRRAAKPAPVWAEGWDASEAEEARARRREQRRRRSSER